MTPDQTRALLGYASSIDPRIRRNDPAERQLQVTAWHTQLQHIAAEDARAAVDAYYAAPVHDAALPGHIRGLAVAAANDRAERNSAAAAITGPELKPMPDEVRDQLRRTRDTWTAPLRMNTPDRNRATPNRTGRHLETDADRARNGRPVTICHRCATETTPPDGWRADNPDSPPVHCQACTDTPARQEAS